MVAGLMRTLGEPWVSVGAAAGSPSEVRSRSPGSSRWYQWGVDVADDDAAGLRDRQGRRAEPARRLGAPVERAASARAAGSPWARPAREAAGGVSGRRRLVVNVDGGARGNPGPAAIAAVVQDADGEVLEERAERIGEATNNVAEYRALLLGIERAAALGAGELELVGDSELIVRQVKGEYKVKDATLRELHARGASAPCGGFESWSIRHVRREQNAEADRLVNEALDGELSAGPIDPGVDIGHVHLKVADLDRALDFYCGVLGFELQQRLGDEAAFVSAGGYHHHIGLNTWHSQRRLAAARRQHRPLPPRDPLPDPARARRRRCAAWRRPACRSPAPPTTASARRSTSSDPDGNGIELYWDRPREEWPRPAGGGGGRHGDDPPRPPRPALPSWTARRPAIASSRLPLNGSVPGTS